MATIRMNRRVLLAAASVAAAAPPLPMAAAGSRRPVRMHVGSQGVALTQASLKFLKRHAVDHIAGRPSEWSEATLVDDLTRAHEFCGKFAISLDVAEQPRLHRPPASAIALKWNHTGPRLGALQHVALAGFERQTPTSSTE